MAHSTAPSIAATHPVKSLYDPISTSILPPQCYFGFTLLHLLGWSKRYSRHCVAFLLLLTQLLQSQPSHHHHHNHSTSGTIGIVSIQATATQRSVSRRVWNPGIEISGWIAPAALVNAQQHHSNTTTSCFSYNNNSHHSQLVHVIGIGNGNSQRGDPWCSTRQYSLSSSLFFGPVEVSNADFAKASVSIPVLNLTVKSNQSATRPCGISSDTQSIGSGCGSR